ARGAAHPLSRVGERVGRDRSCLPDRAPSWGRRRKAAPTCELRPRRRRSMMEGSMTEPSPPVPAEYLAPNAFVDCDHAAVVAYAERHVSSEGDVATAVAL